jgi:RHS repeat-associated protein
MFAGVRYDIEIGLYYNRARYYNPYTGRFLQTDPVGYGAGMNLYAYCNNNPIVHRDPSGCDPTDAGDYKDDAFDLDDPCGIPDGNDSYYVFKGFKICFYRNNPYATGSPRVTATTTWTIEGLRWTFKIGKYVVGLHPVTKATLAFADAYALALEKVAKVHPKILDELDAEGPWCAYIIVDKYERRKSAISRFIFGEYEKTESNKYIQVIRGKAPHSLAKYGIYETETDALDAIREARDMLCRAE